MQQILGGKGLNDKCSMAGVRDRCLTNHYLLRGRCPHRPPHFHDRCPTGYDLIPDVAGCLPTGQAGYHPPHGTIFNSIFIITKKNYYGNQQRNLT